MPTLRQAMFWTLEINKCKIAVYQTNTNSEAENSTSAVPMFSDSCSM